MNKEQIDLLGEYIKAKQNAILIEMVPESVIKKGVVINSDCSKEELMGHYENLKYVVPKWYEKLIQTSKEHIPVLIIKDINSVSENEQRKFIELLKYRKVYTNKLPKKCMIFVTYKDLEKNPIDEEVYSLLVQI